MKNTLRFLLAFLIAFVLMLVVRSAGLTLYTVSDASLEPVFQAGDRLMVNRWSYGLRVGGKNAFFDYGRIGYQAVERGDLVAIVNPQHTDQVFICRVAALPGDSVRHDGQTFIVPSLKDCADADYYWMESVSKTEPRPLGFIAEEYIIGRVFMVAYSRDPSQPLWRGWRHNRMFLPF